MFLVCHPKITTEILLQPSLKSKYHRMKQRIIVKRIYTRFTGPQIKRLNLKTKTSRYFEKDLKWNYISLLRRATLYYFFKRYIFRPSSDNIYQDTFYFSFKTIESENKIVNWLDALSIQFNSIQSIWFKFTSLSHYYFRFQYTPQQSTTPQSRNNLNIGLNLEVTVRRFFWSVNTVARLLCRRRRESVHPFKC